MSTALRYVGLGSLSLFFVAITLSLVTIPAIDGWYDQWAAYVAALEGCADLASCSTSRFNLWTKFVPWGMAFGSLAGSLALTSPFVRHRTDTRLRAH